MPNFQIICKGHIFYDYNKSEKNQVFLRSISYHDFFIKSTEVLVYDDVKIQFFHKNQKTFHLWFNTWFIDDSGQLFLNKNMIDKASGDKRCLKYDMNFSMKIFLTRVEEFKLAPK